MARAALKTALGSRRVVGTFLKLPSVDVVDLAARAGYDFVVVDAEHSQLPYSAVSGLVRHAYATGLPALVRVPAVDPGLVNRLLEAGAAGIQLSTVRRRADVDALVAATRYAPHGTRSVSLSHPAAGYGADGLPAYLAAEAQCPPLLVGQFETATFADPLPALMPGLDVAFVGTTDLTVSLGGSPPSPAIAAVSAAAAAAGVAFGGWASALPAAFGDFVVIGSDVQLLGKALREALDE
ncbi:HpcH/HpaI aldolase family protein [Phytohabitans rumicis]|uniref:4-hydroxy-2-oxovalerate aldolase n=1 Tax=Phytohabitans rumicis TaxID=1076125 RepID=A0A6V8LHX1_9ACTN|nr:aldolase/citrate lyase family protein [Phytohabitans rumicis]GFJ94501.1 4-hydroxy-2-oxovalerate aldolase [Phytohabitans rumicis]